MMFLIDLNLDGYLTQEERMAACREFIKDQLDFTASSVKILWDEDSDRPLGEFC